MPCQLGISDHIRGAIFYGEVRQANQTNVFWYWKDCRMRCLAIAVTIESTIKICWIKSEKVVDRAKCVSIGFQRITHCNKNNKIFLLANNLHKINHWKLIEFQNLSWQTWIQSRSHTDWGFNNRNVERRQASWLLFYVPVR